MKLIIKKFIGDSAGFDFVGAVLILVLGSDVRDANTFEMLIVDSAVLVVVIVELILLFGSVTDEF